MELIFVRHGEPAWERDGYGVDDPDLTERGRTQAEAAAAALAERGIDEVLVSPLARAQQTAAPIAAALGIGTTTLDWLAEIHPGRFEGTPIEQVEEAFRLNRGQSLEDLWNGMPGGESFHAFHDRVTSGLRAMLADIGATELSGFPPLWRLDRPERRVAIVAHGGTNAVAIGHLLAIQPTPWEWERFVSQHASISTLRPFEISSGWSFSLDRFSDVEHIPPDLRTR